MEMIKLIKKRFIFSAPTDQAREDQCKAERKENRRRAERRAESRSKESGRRFVSGRAAE